MMTARVKEFYRGFVVALELRDGRWSIAAIASEHGGSPLPVSAVGERSLSQALAYAKLLVDTSGDADKA